MNIRINTRNNEVTTLNDNRERPVNQYSILLLLYPCLSVLSVVKLFCTAMARTKIDMPVSTVTNGFDTLERRLRVAQGQEAGDLLLTDGQVVNVFTQRVERANVIIADGWIAGVGLHDWHATQSISVSGKFIAPGFIDSHAHLESTLLTPAELARLIVPHGTTAWISDSHEIGNVLGIPGIDLLLSASGGLPLDCFFMASSCVPATHWEHAGARPWGGLKWPESYWPGPAS